MQKNDYCLIHNSFCNWREVRYMTSKNIIITIVIALIVGVVAFFGGMKFQQSQVVPQNGQFARFGQEGRFAGRGGGMATVGKIISSDSNSITVQLQDGSSKIVNFSSSTKIVKSQAAATSDLTSGTEVAVFGTTNSDGSVTAQNIQLNPQLRMGGNQPRPTQ